VAALADWRTNLFSVANINMAENVNTQPDITPLQEKARNMTSLRDVTGDVTREAEFTSQSQQLNAGRSTQTIHQLTKFSQYMTKFLGGKDILNGRDMNILSPTTL
jgi:hypothetical protein